MRRFRTGLFLLASILVALPTSCNRPSEPPVETVPAEDIAEKPRSIVAESTADRLRVRALPYLDEEIVTYLSRGQGIIVESRTEWKQALDGMEEPWYFIRTEVEAGWTYGGFLVFSGSDSAEVPINPALPEPSSEPAMETEGPIDTADLPEILLPIFGLETEPLVFGGGEGTIGYDAVTENLVLPFDEGSDSGVSAFAAGEATLKLVAEHASGIRFEYIYNTDELRLLSGTWHGSGSSGSDAALLPFHRLASLPGGAWEIYAFAGNDNWPAAIGRIEISPGEVSAVRKEDPNPLTDDPNSTYRRGDTVFCYGVNPGSDGMIQVALYHDTRETRDSMVLLKPMAARKVKVNGDDTWHTAIPLGKDLPEGRYWVAVGDPIQGVEEVRLFITSVSIVSE